VVKGARGAASPPTRFHVCLLTPTLSSYVFLRSAPAVSIHTHTILCARQQSCRYVVNQDGILFIFSQTPRPKTRYEETPLEKPCITILSRHSLRPMHHVSMLARVEPSRVEAVSSGNHRVTPLRLIYSGRGVRGKTFSGAVRVLVWRVALIAFWGRGRERRRSCGVHHARGEWA
jgi:hypothetical protein